MKRFIDCVIPFRTCNLRCEYCYITHTKSWKQKLPLFLYDADHIKRALTVKRLGGVCLVNICGEGETLLPSQTVKILSKILENGHYVMLVTNGTITNRFNEIANLPSDLLNRLLIKFSFHFMELKRKGWLNSFFNNVQKIKDAGCSFSVELTPHDEMLPYIDDAISLCNKKVGAICHVTVARNERNPSLGILTEHSKDTYEEIWKKFQSDLFKFKMQVFGERRREFCYAGLWSGVLNLVTGEFKRCYRGDVLQNIFCDIDQPIRFSPIGKHCPEAHCYNAHAFMTLGVIPEIKTPRFFEMRNRVCENGSEWLTPGMKIFLSKKLCDENRELTCLEKHLYAIDKFANRTRLVRKSKSLFSMLLNESIKK
jgi:organic radical activating enzyme